MNLRTFFTCLVTLLLPLWSVHSPASDASKPELKKIIKKRESDKPDAKVIEAAAAPALGDDVIKTRLYATPGHHRNFLDCVKSRKQTLTPAETAHRSASIGHLGQIAMKVGRKLKWNPITEQFLDDPLATRLLSTPMRAPWHV